MTYITPNDIHNIHNFDTLLDFLRGKLGWDIPEAVELEDIAFPWSAEDLDLDELTEELIVNCQQLPPFPTNQPTFAFVEDTQPWGIFFLQFNSELVYRTTLRRILRGLVQRRDRDANLPAWEHDQLLFICTTTDFQHFAFAHFAATTENWRRAVLSIFSWEQGDTHIRTLCEYNLPALAFPIGGFSNGREWLQEWQKAFDVKAVTDKFFADYQRVFASVENAVEGIPWSETEKRRLYTQRLFNRLMFLRFIEKKGWLTYNGSPNYLRAIFDATEVSETDENFLNDRLHWTFFHGLGNSENLPQDLAEVVERRGEVPFLNGGLFEKHEYDQRNAIHIPNDKIAEILKLFERYNFTVNESTPLDIEVAVDPEMLGKVFEELVRRRHDTGSYYTRRLVVSFMCRESLKICLQEKTDETPEILQAFVDDADATKVQDPEKVLLVLQTLRICDPACGSGAYLLGMMSELLRLREALFQSNQIDSPIIYQRKLDIIQKNLYGVDKDDFAVNIAMLRLWLSLAVDYEGDTPKPLPNLDYKVAVGDSLIGASPENMSFATSLIQEVLESKAEFFVTHTDPEKQRLREVIAELKENLRGWQASEDEFVWQVEFPEIFQKGGFDIVIGNPPYIQLQKDDGKLANLYQDKGFETFARTGDIYCLFYEKANQLLKNSGYVCFITSNKWMRAGYGKKLRDYFATSTQPIQLLDMGPDIFDASTVDTNILLFQNTLTDETIGFRAVTIGADFDRQSGNLAQYLSDNGATMEIPPKGEPWAILSSAELNLKRKIEDVGKPLKDWDINIYRGIVTGCNAAFIIDECKREELINQDPNSAEIIKSLLRGKDIKRYHAQQSGFYILATGYDLDIPRRYPAIYEHLETIGEQIELGEIKVKGKGLFNRDDQGENWWNLRTCAYYPEFEKEKIVYPETTQGAYFFFDNGQYYLDKTCFMITGNGLKILVGLLSSTLMEFAYKHIYSGTVLGAKGYQYNKHALEKLPVVEIPAAQQQSFIALVDKILTTKHTDPKADISSLEDEIDKLVYALYNLTDDEIAIVEARE